MAIDIHHHHNAAFIITSFNHLIPPWTIELLPIFYDFVEVSRAKIKYEKILATTFTLQGQGQGRGHGSTIFFYLIVALGAPIHTYHRNCFGIVHENNKWQSMHICTHAHHIQISRALQHHTHCTSPCCYLLFSCAFQGVVHY